VDGTIMEPMGTKLLTPFPCPRCNAPTHAVTVEVKFRVEVDVKAESEDEAMQMAEKKIQAKYDRELKSSMVGSPNRVDVEAEWADEYEDSQNTEPTRREPETHTNHKP
jgi:transcription elongation factor Elf1